MADQVVIKPIYIVEGLGEYALIPDGAIINIGGVAGPGFLVGGKPLLFADGTATDGSAVTNRQIDLQTVYQNSVGTAFIDFTAGKDFVLQAVNKNRFTFDADTGLVTISGDLKVLGSSTTVINTDVVSDKVWINQRAGDYIPFKMEPRPGVMPAVNVVDIKVLNGGPSVFYIDPAGSTHVQNLVTGTINGINLPALYEQFSDHANLEISGIRHKASQISVDFIEGLPGNNVQAVLENVVSTIRNISVSARGYEHVQSDAQEEWTIVHAQGTRRIQITIWDGDDEIMMSDSVRILDDNTLVVEFNTPTTGRAILMLF